MPPRLPMVGKRYREVQRHRKLASVWRRHPVTVCIAALCLWQNPRTPPFAHLPPKLPMIVGAADQMYTSGDIEYETPQTKIAVLTPHIVALAAGDMAVQHAICSATRAAIHASGGAPSVTDVATVYAQQLAQYRQGYAERKILNPIGLDWNTFYIRQHQMNPNLMNDFVAQMQETDLLDVETIITGTDNTGAHIVTIEEPGIMSWVDGAGFAAIGYGGWHAQSQFMFSRYAPIWPFERALFLTYRAKKRAEVAPGVGPETTVFWIGPGVAPILMLPTGDPTLRDLDQVYRDTRSREDEVTESGYARLNEILQARSRLASEQIQQRQAGQPEPPQAGQPEPPQTNGNPPSAT